MYSKSPAFRLMSDLSEKIKHIEIFSYIESERFKYKYNDEFVYINMFGLNQRTRSWIILCYDYLKTDNFISFTVHENERILLNNVNISENDKILNISYYGLFNFNIFKVNGLNVLKL